jgi:hypothetical protein
MINDLTLTELKEKISKIEEDLASLQRDGDSGRKFEVLTEYLEYMRDELKFLQKEQRDADNKNAS